MPQAHSGGRSIDIDARINASPVGPLQWRIVVICFILAMIDGFDAQAIAFVAPLLKDEFAIPAPEMGLLFSSALLGLMVGAFVFSPVADRIGRKPVIVVSCAIMGVFALLTATAGSTTELFVYRFLTGLGLGGVMPNINTLTSEFAPARKRAFLMTAMFVGFPFGAVAGGLVSNVLIATYGWSSVFILGGVAPLLMIAVAAPFLPESIRFLALKGGRDNDIGASLANIDKNYSYQDGDRFVVAGKTGGGSITGLFSQGRAVATLLIWVVVFANLLMMYSLLNWLPSVMREAGLPLERAILSAVIFNLGGVIGGLVIARAIDGRGPFGVLSIAFAAAAVAIALIGVSTASLVLAFAAVFVGGFTLIGSQFGMNALVVNFYPTDIRSTGLGWSLAVGRIGSVIGPIIVGLVLVLEWSLPQVFLLAAAPALVCLGAVMLLARREAPRS
ncbi:MAG: MFS transporter [Pseudomonadota bacterium]